MLKQPFIRIRPEWNIQGPPIPVWFRAALKRIDPRLTLQFIPPRFCDSRPEGETLYPHGVWHIGVKMKRTGLLHPGVVWSLTDFEGNYSPPGPDTVRLIRYAYSCRRARRMDVMEEMIDRAIAEYEYQKHRESKEELHRSITDVCSKVFPDFRRVTHRVFLRRDKVFE